MARVMPLVPGVTGDRAYASFSARAFGWGETFKIFAVPLLAALLIPIIILYVFTVKPDRTAAKLTLWGVYAFGLCFLSAALIGPLLFSISSDTQTFLRSTPVGLAKATVIHNRDPQWLLHIGGIVSLDNAIQGGFSVPLFVIILAMVGGVVNMLLQLPTCLNSYYTIAITAPNEDVVAKFRKDVCTYFVGILSAPFLGIIVYSILAIADYNNQAAIAVAALSVGFASNTIIDSLLRTLGNILKVGGAGTEKKEET